MQIGVIAEFVGDGRFWAVATVDGGVRGELCYDILQAGHEVIVVPALKVGTADTHAEEGVAGEGGVFCLAVEHHTTGGVTRGLQDRELVVAETNHLVMAEVTAYGWEVATQRCTDDGLELSGQVGDEELVLSGNLDLQTIGVVDGVDAEVVVEVAMGGQQMDRAQVLALDILRDGGSLLLIVGPAVDDDAFAGLVADYVGILLQEVTNECLDIQHGCVYLLIGR